MLTIIAFIGVNIITDAFSHDNNYTRLYQWIGYTRRNFSADLQKSEGF